eukprot:9608802-Alexandrium_andersonii.AAC.1
MYCLTALGRLSRFQAVSGACIPWLKAHESAKQMRDAAKHCLELRGRARTILSYAVLGASQE